MCEINIEGSNTLGGETFCYPKKGFIKRVSKLMFSVIKRVDVR